jgi:hypothetical protein
MKSNHVINVIVSCSNRKRFPVTQGCSLRQIAGHNLTLRANRWLSNLKKNNVPEHKAERLYGGDHWSIVRAIGSQSLNRRIRARVWICSAGYGLVPYEAALKSYRATFSRGHRDSVSRAKSPKDCSLENRLWWDLLGISWPGPAPGEPRRLRDIPRIYGKSPMLVALSADYLEAVAKDLRQLLSDPYYRTHLHVISCGSQNLGTLLSTQILPCDASMQAAVGGARVSLNVRIAAHLIRHLKTGAETREALIKVCDAIERKPLSIIKRVPVSDSDVRSFIKSEFRKNPRLSRSTLLQLLRKKRFACEQSRFARLYTDSIPSQQRSLYA